MSLRLHGVQMPLEPLRLDREAADGVACIFEVEGRYFVQDLCCFFVQLNILKARVIRKVVEDCLQHAQPLVQVIVPRLQRRLRLR